MKKFTKLILGAVFSVGCLFAFAGCGNQQVSDLQDQVSDLQGQISDLRENFTGSPKFNYDSIDEPISYYIQGTKIFDFTITDFSYKSTTHFVYTVEFQPAFAVNQTTTYPFTATLYDSSKQVVYSSNSNEVGSMYFNVNTGSEATLGLYYIHQPFACITMVPTVYNPA